MNTNGAQEIIYNALASSPLAMVLFWMVWTGNKKIDKKDEQIDKMNEKLTTLVENNTNALGTMVNTINEQTDVAKTLNDRIYTVLTRVNDK